MALHLNLLHEEIQEQRQRQRDPLKIGMMVLGGIGAIMFLYYMWNAYQTLGIRRRLNVVQESWSKVEPKVTAAQKRSAELNGIIGTTKVLDGMIDSRFYWAPFLEKLSRCVAPNAQLTSVDGVVLEENRGVTVMIEGLAAGREPRAAAEELRQLLLEQLGQSYHEVKVEFKTLEDMDTLVKIGGANMAMARFALSATFNQVNTAKAAPPPAKKK
jgi:Tfp pilus assembly protein PilN